MWSPGRLARFAVASTESPLWMCSIGGIIARLFAPLVLAASLTLKIDPHVAATFDPERALGATIDAHSRDETAELFTPANTAAIRSAGFHPLSYRLATELDGEAWHWNPRGTWTNAKLREGYWTSDDDSPTPITNSYGY